MRLRSRSGGWCLLLLAAVVSGLHLQEDEDAPQPEPDAEPSSQAQIYWPVLQPSEAIPPIGTYMLKSTAGKPCIKITMGVEYIVKSKQKTWYFNLNPSRVKETGYCGRNITFLSLTLPDNTSGLQLTFKKEKKVFYISKMTAKLSPQPVCRRCANKTYFGLLDHNKLFKTADGWSFSCKSESLFWMSSELRIKLVPLQMQAFTLRNGRYGKEVECWADFNKRVVPIILGATAVGVILTAVLTFLLIKDRPRQGYERL